LGGVDVKPVQFASEAGFRFRAHYLSESVNLAQALAGTFSVKPSRLVVSLTRITPAQLAVSTQALPDVPE
jgi:hypothetical protein